jgi:hypothetical protein
MALHLRMIRRSQRGLRQDGKTGATDNTDRKSDLFYPCYLWLNNAETESQPFHVSRASETRPIPASPALAKATESC